MSKVNKYYKLQMLQSLIKLWQFLGTSKNWMNYLRQLSSSQNSTVNVRHSGLYLTHCNMTATKAKSILTIFEAQNLT